MRRRAALTAIATATAVGLLLPPTTFADDAETAPEPSADAGSDFAQHRGNAPAGWPGRGSGKPPSAVVDGRTYAAANPYLAMLPTTQGVDWEYWERWAAESALADHAEPMAGTTSGLLHEELEPAGLLGGNDAPRSAERIEGFGSEDGEEPAVTILGSQARERVETRRVEPSREDDGAIPLARGTGIGSKGAGIRTTGVIGNGPHGSDGTGRGDFDYFKVRLPAGRQIVASMAAGERSDLEPLVAIWDESGDLLDFAFPRGESAELTTILPAGTYYVMASGCCTYPRSRFRSGRGTGAESEGAYTLSIAATRPDRDFYAVHLDVGDVLGGTLQDARLATVHAPDGTPVFGSGQDASFIYPDSTTLPGGGDAVVDHVAAVSGWHTVEVSYGAGRYRMDLEVYSAGLEGQPAGATQTLFLDFDGQRLNTSIFGGWSGVRELSPMSAFLGRWRLSASRENAVIDAVIASVRENLQEDLVAHGDGSSDIIVLNSRDHADPWGQPNVSRIIVGGSIAESHLPTIGIAESIDPGNLDQEETAVLLLDLLSGPSRKSYSINHYVSPDTDRVVLVSRVLGNLIAHEAGHFLGNWHVDQFDGDANLMDQGGNFRAIFGIGRDGIGGTDDDRDVDFGVNHLNPFEGFFGWEDTAARTALGLRVGQQ